MKPHILMVDDEQAIQFGFAKYLSKVGYDIQTVSTLAEAKETIHSDHFDAVLLDMKLPDGNGLDWVEELRSEFADIAIVMITGHGDIPLAVNAMRKGADHFLTKPVNMLELDVFLKKSLELGALRRENLTSKRLKKKFEPFFGENKSMRKILELATLTAESETTVLLLGETGTGKGVMARWIHNHSQRSTGQFVEINCTSMKGELLTSELFGHARGAFTSAVRDKEGLIEVASDGTLFLDEISDMDIDIQAQFLKVIEEKQFRRLGEVKVRKSKFRLICASNKNLALETKEGRFRQDLFYRINVFPIQIPPLRERLDDLQDLTQYMLKFIGRNHAEITPEVMKLLSNYHWPGNVREMKNVLERALLLAQGTTIVPEFFPGLNSQEHSEDGLSLTTNLDKMEQKHIQSVLNRLSGDTKKAAKALGISRASLYRKLNKYQEGIDS